MEVLLAVIFIIAGVLQIILFFKIWSMTNDVRNLKEQLEQYDMYAIYAKTYGPKLIEEYLTKHPHVVEIVNFDANRVYCALSPEGGYLVTGYWILKHKKKDEDLKELTFRVTGRVTCRNISDPMSLDSWVRLNEPAAKISLSPFFNE